MTTAGEIQSLLRFLSQDAKIPISKAMGAIKGLQAAKLITPQLIASSSLQTLRPIFEDDKSAKQVHNAAKRVNKKRAAPEAESSPAKKKRPSEFELQSSGSTEASLALPESSRNEDEISKTVLITNRAPLVLAFGVVLLKYTMPEQPLSSRLSLAQAAVSMNSRSKAVNLGIEKGPSAEEEGWGMGQVKVKVMGREVRTMKRIGWEDEDAPKSQNTDQTESLEKPVYWALDLEALKSHNEGLNDGTGVGLASNLPIYTPQSARSYLMRSFTTRRELKMEEPAPKAARGRTRIAEQTEQNISWLLGALEMLFESWCGNLTADELDRKAWSWYVQVRPTVADGVSGWGAKGDLKLRDILDLRRKP